MLLSFPYNLQRLEAMMLLSFPYNLQRLEAMMLLSFQITVFKNEKKKKKTEDPIGEIGHWTEDRAP